ncbi:hypothetical protein llap_8210 [Limosa lapponica baueri]|uniref:Uncharacterized protein n=1 Tax=Limosa lapponica baueri TaxID=1758121 RepID=A0A2I0U5Z3_LIMLA|nr:hypothetical protein llap_8210 [Limosa lapponica baueri]
MATGCSGGILSVICRLIGKRKEEKKRKEKKRKEKKRKEKKRKEKKRKEKEKRKRREKQVLLRFICSDNSYRTEAIASAASTRQNA